MVLDKDAALKWLEDVSMISINFNRSYTDMNLPDDSFMRQVPNWTRTAGLTNSSPRMSVFSIPTILSSRVHL